MDFDEVLKHNKEVKRLFREKCSHDELDEIRVIFKRCKTCGKLVPVRDEEYIKQHGEIGRGPDY